MLAILVRQISRLCLLLGPEDAKKLMSAVFNGESQCFFECDTTRYDSIWDEIEKLGFVLGLEFKDDEDERIIKGFYIYW